MRDAVQQPAPAWRAVALENFLATGVSIRREAVVLGAVLVGVTLLVGVNHLMTGASFDFSIEMALPVAILGLFAPMAVWKGEEPFRRSYFWALPVDRARHTLVKVIGGWGWLMVLISAYLLWALGLSVLTGGEVGVEEVRLLLHALPEGARPTSADYFLHRQATPAWQWLVPFTGATISYLLGSIVVLASDHPWRWFGGLIFGYLLLGAMAQAGQAEALGRLLAGLTTGPYGLEMMITGSGDRAAVLLTPSGQTVERMLDQPLPHEWSRATLLWSAVSLAGLLVAALRHQER
jgi:hypothetical protein